MAKRLSRIERDIERLKEKISEYQQQLKELEAAKTEQENLQIIQLVRSMNMKPDEFAAFLRSGALNVGRQTAQGLYNLCTPVSTAQVKPGDLVFFKGTYDTPGVSHCGIYVGNSIMLHCGDPISYTNLNSKYWQEHFYSYGRLP